MVDPGCLGGRRRVDKEVPGTASPLPLPAPVVKTLFVLAVGVAIGYTYGYKDAKTHDKMVVERMLDRAGGAARGKYDPNVDVHADSVSR